eukprot:scaffold12507_cov28-Tisochrysis_lutea.AAC.2
MQPEPAAPHAAPAQTPAPPDEPPLHTEAEKIAYLRSRGVEIELAEERNEKRAVRAEEARTAGKRFEFVRVPADDAQPVAAESAISGPSDVLSALLAPRFASDAAMDTATVSRETAGRLRNMLAGGAAGAAETLKAPSASTMTALAAGGACEAYPLAQGSATNGWRSVRMYIDEVGALRKRPRNRRAELLAAAAGLSGLSIHGDVYIGRCEREDGASGMGAEVNVDFRVEELAHDAEWVQSARRGHMEEAARSNHADGEHLAKGDHGVYSWSQTEDEVEVRRRPVCHACFEISTASGERQPSGTLPPGMHSCLERRRSAACAPPAYRLRLPMGAGPTPTPPMAGPCSWSAHWSWLSASREGGPWPRRPD